MEKLPSQPEYAQKETCQAITLRSGREIKGSSKKQIVVDDEDVGIEEAKISGTTDDDEISKKDKKGDAMPPKEGEPKVDLKTLPFPQRYIRRSLDKQFGKFLSYLKEITITIPFVEAIRDMELGENF